MTLTNESAKLPTYQTNKQSKEYKMNGMEAKYTAKHLAKMIKHNRKIAQRAFMFYDNHINNFDTNALDKFAIARHVSKETYKLSLEFRAFMIHNAFKKNRAFTSAEVEFHNLGENAVADLKNDNEKYAQYMDKFQKQQKAINIVKHTMLQTATEIVEFSAWIAATATHDDNMVEAVREAMKSSRAKTTQTV